MKKLAILSITAFLLTLSSVSQADPITVKIKNAKAIITGQAELRVKVSSDAVRRAKAALRKAREALGNQFAIRGNLVNLQRALRDIRDAISSLDSRIPRHHWADLNKRDKVITKLAKKLEAEITKLRGETVAAEQVLIKKIHQLERRAKAMKPRLQLMANKSLSNDTGDIQFIVAGGLNLVLPLNLKWNLNIGGTVGAELLDPGFGWNLVVSTDYKWRSRLHIGPATVVNGNSGNFRGMQSWSTGLGLMLRLPLSNGFTPFTCPFLGVGGAKAEVFGNSPSFGFAGGVVTGITFDVL